MSLVKTCKCKINNQEVEIAEGSSIIEAFKKSGQEIAHYCWHPGLSVAGVCRLCMVEVEGMPKLQIACNTEVKDGMVISTQSEQVKEAVRWGLEFHLINHPLDCPICDQAGECELQDQYMKFGRYRPGMAERKVKKRKVIDLGPKIVLDSERCILCSRCVRFTEEVSQTRELGIFNRGDRCEIGVFKDKPLDNNYSLNTVDICPVGALTAKDFRFRQRVWYLKTAESVCTGCSAGCNTYVDYNEEGLFRVRPRYHKQINGHWMCDQGRKLYQLTNKKGRLLSALGPKAEVLDSIKTLQTLKPQPAQKNGAVNNHTSNNQAAANHIVNNQTVENQNVNNHTVENQACENILILTAQYTTEEYESLVSFFTDCLGRAGDIYYWQNNIKSFDDFDGLLLRGDRNPNTGGLLKVLKKASALNKWEHLSPRLEGKRVKQVWVAGPENQQVYPLLAQYAKWFDSCAQQVVWWTAQALPVEGLKCTWQIPVKTCFEKSGVLMNHAGIEQKIQAVQGQAPEGILSLTEAVHVLKGEEHKLSGPLWESDMKTNYWTLNKGAL